MITMYPSGYPWVQNIKPESIALSLMRSKPIEQGLLFSLLEVGIMILLKIPGAHQKSCYCIY